MNFTKKVFLAISFIVTTTTLGANENIESFSKAKKLMKKVYKSNQTTFYGNCNYNYKDKSNMIVRESCGYKPRNEYTKKGKKNQRARRIECTC